jgi:sec-independent protein translocase protein TatA
MLSGLDSPLHIIVIVFALMLLFGAKRLPEMGRSLGQGLREFKDSVSGDEDPVASPPHQLTRLASSPTEAPPVPTASPAAARPALESLGDEARQAAIASLPHESESQVSGQTVSPD